MQTQIAELSSEFKKLETTTETLKSQLNETTAKKRSLNDQLINSDFIVENLKRQLQESKSSSDLITNDLQYQIESLKIVNNNISKTNCDLHNQIFNQNTSISLSSSISLSQAEIQYNELQKINLDLNDQIKKLSNNNSILLAEGNRLLNEHNALKTTAELMMKEGNSLLREKNHLLIQLRNAENNQTLTTQKFNAEISKLKKDLCELK